MATARQDPAERVRELMERIADAAGIDASVEVREAQDGLHAEYVGDDLGLLIGHHGQTIDAIQHLAYRIASKGGEDRVSVLVDAAGYRERRAETLRATADQAAQTAISRGRAVPLEAMSVETYSEGQEPSRHLVVAPLVD
jgi:spoIIIJ-associated protein